MAFTRKMLKAMSIDDELIEQIIEAHIESIDALKADRDKYKDEADKVEGLEQQIETLKEEKSALEAEKSDLQKELDENDSYKEKYESEHEAFEDYKKGIDAEQEKAKTANAYRELLKKAGVNEKRIDAIMKLAPLDDVELDEDGNVKGSEKLIEDIKSEWSEFIVTESVKGAGTETPPSNTGGQKLTKAEIMAIKDMSERQRAISENHELFGY